MLCNGQFERLEASGVGDTPCERIVARFLHWYCVMSVFSSRLRGRWTRLRRDEDGVTAVEFGFVATFLLGFLIALMEVGLVFFSTITLEHAVEQSSRLIRTGQAQTQGLTASSFKDEVCSHVSGLIDCGDDLKIDVQRFDKFSTISLSEPLDGNDELRDDFDFNPGTAGDIVVVRAFYGWKLMSIFSNFFSAFTPDYSGLSNMADGSVLLVGTAAFRNEPFN